MDELTNVLECLQRVYFDANGEAKKLDRSVNNEFSNWVNEIYRFGWKVLGSKPIASFDSEKIIGHRKNGLCVLNHMGSFRSIFEWVYSEYFKENNENGIKIPIALIPISGLEIGNTEIVSNEFEAVVRHLSIISPINITHPFILVGFSHKPQLGQPELIEIPSATVGPAAINKTIEFPPEYRHAGITILSNFSSLVRDKYKDSNVKVSIQQEKDKVILIIESDEGVLERIEETLQTYGLVLSGKAPVEDLTNDPFKIAELNQQIRIAQMQLENQKELLAIEQRHNRQLEDKNMSIKSQYKEMIGIFNDSIKSKDKENTFLRTLIKSSTTTQSETAKSALNTLIGILEKDNGKGDNAEVAKNLEEIKVNDPTAFAKIKGFAESCAAGVVGNSLYSWIVPIINSLAK
ncbi:MAG: hypothetical protein HRT35_23550 [Algicola sp.]|nr:hypothetical protein [Algicola sp.]